MPQQTTTTSRPHARRIPNRWTLPSWTRKNAQLHRTVSGFHITFYLFSIQNMKPSIFCGGLGSSNPRYQGNLSWSFEVIGAFPLDFFIFYASGRIFWSLINWYKTRQQFFDANTSIPIGWRKIKLEIRLSKEIMDIVNALFYTSLLKEKTLHYCHYSILWFLVQVKSS